MVVWSGVVLMALASSAFLFAFRKAEVIYNYSDTVDLGKLPKIDVLVILAGARGRISQGMDLWMRYRDASRYGVIPKLPVFYVAGTGKDFQWKDFLEHVREGERSLIPEEMVFLEKESVNTKENAEFFFKNAHDKNWRRFVLMTSSYHMRRSEMLFDRYNTHKLEYWTYTVTQDPFNKLEWAKHWYGIRITLIEYLKFIQEVEREI